MSPSSTESDHPAKSVPRQLGLQVVVVIVGAAIGLAYLKFVHYALEVLWTDVPDAIDDDLITACYIVGMTTLGAAAVAYLRRRTKVMGHSPLDGLKVTFDPVRVSLITLTLVVITLLAGAVLGPEAGLIAIGTALGMYFSGKSKSDERASHKLVNAGVLGAIISLALQLGIGRTINITSGPVSLAWIDLVSSIPAAIAAAVVTALVRVLAYRIRAHADVVPPRVGRVALVGALVGLCGIVSVTIAHINPRLILGSGEGFIVEVIGITSMSTLLIVIVVKAVAYALCLGGGIRGGPIFPAMFLGAATATVFTLLGFPGETTAIVAAGVLASTSVGVALGWRAAIIGGAVIGLLLGSWLLIAPSIVGLVIGRLTGDLLRRVPGVGPVSNH